MISSGVISVVEVRRSREEVQLGCLLCEARENPLPIRYLLALSFKIALHGTHLSSSKKQYPSLLSDLLSCNL